MTPEADIRLGEARRARAAAPLIENGNFNAVFNMEEGWTPLMNAAERGDLSTVLRLLAAPGIDVNLTSQAGDTALCLAACNGHADVVTSLLSVDGIDANRPANGDAPLASSVYHGHANVVAALLAAPDINVHDTESIFSEGRTALEIAIDQGDDVAAAILRARGRMTRSVRQRVS